MHLKPHMRREFGNRLAGARGGWPSWRGPLLQLAVVAGVLAQASWLARPVRAAESPGLTIAGWSDVQELIATQKGRVVVVNIWTTTCGTCVAEFPKFVSLREKFPANRVACLAVACDYDGIKEKPPEFYRKKVLDFLAAQKAGRIDNILLNVPFVDFLEQMELKTTPAVLVYGPDGKLARRFDNDDAAKVSEEFTTEQVVEYVEELLKAEAK